MATVFDRPPPLAAVLLGPAQQGEVITTGRAERPRPEFTSMFVDRNDGVAALVRVDT